MCGRFSLGLQVNPLPRYFVHRLTKTCRSQAINIAAAVAQAYPDEDIQEWVNEDAFVPRHNVAPRSQSPVLRRSGSSASSASETTEGGRAKHASPASADDAGKTPKVILQTMKWGLVPHWAKQEDKTLNTINARAENLLSGGGMWGSIKGKRRCVVPCEGCAACSCLHFDVFSFWSRYFEWLKKGNDRLPHFTKHKNGNIMLLAGLYDVAHLEGLQSCIYQRKLLIEYCSFTRRDFCVIYFHHCYDLRCEGLRMATRPTTRDPVSALRRQHVARYIQRRLDR